MPRIARVNTARRCAALLRHERELGSTFECAWERSVEAALAAYRRGERTRDEWRQALQWAKPAFARAYHNEPRQRVDWLEPLPLPEFLPGQERIVVLR